MTTRKWPAMGLTIALALMASALWLRMESLPHPGDGISPPPDPRATNAPPQLPLSTHADTFEHAPAASAAPAAATPAPEPKPIDDICRWGYEIQRGPDGDVEGIDCAQSSYRGYSTETLEVMAYGDAEAASMLAHRLRYTDYPRALRMAIRAAALSGGDISTLISATRWRPITDANGDYDLSGVAQAYVLESLGDMIRHGRYTHTTTYERVLQQIADDPGTLQQQLDEVVDNLFEEARLIELNVTGNSTIGGDGDV